MIFPSGLINAVTMIITLGAWAFVANLLQKREEAQELARMRKEVLREQEYKEAIFPLIRYLFLFLLREFVCRC